MNCADPACGHPRRAHGPSGWMHLATQRCYQPRRRLGTLIRTPGNCRCRGYWDPTPATAPVPSVDECKKAA